MLFEKLETVRGKVPKRLKKQYEQARQEFMNLYGSYLPSSLAKSDGRFALQTSEFCPTGVDLLEKVSKKVDFCLNKYLENNEISCKRGCSLCCKQLICCTRLEMESIIKHLDTLTKVARKDIKKKLKKESVKFAVWTSKSLSGIQEHSLISDPIRAKYQGKACIFLNRDICRIYPVRPIVCRVTKVDDGGCGRPVPLGSDYKGQKPLKLFYDQIAIDLVKQEEKRLFGEIKMLPVVAWPLTSTFKKYFF